MFIFVSKDAATKLSSDYDYNFLLYFSQKAGLVRSDKETC